MKKIIAAYLPQFHSIPENDEWWGKGFTEWTNVKKSIPMFKGHNQPEIPLNGNYYCLLDENVQIWQANLAKKYGVYGFCYYHYWFNGKLLLEKPMENMLKNPLIDIPFCICWANESWARTWNGQENNLLIKQIYSEKKEDWKNHFDYLLPFFKDDRYIKVNGRPMLLLYKPQLIVKCKEMIDYWNCLAKEEGFEGLYIGAQHHSVFDFDKNKLGIEYRVEFEPFFTVRELIKEVKTPKGFIKYLIENPKSIVGKACSVLFHRSMIFDYDEIWTKSINRKPEFSSDIPGAFPAWDNTPRKGKNSKVFWKPNPKKFEKYMKDKIIQSNIFYDSEFIFMNAWNEWAEGAHLEPDEINKYGYLEALYNALNEAGR